MTRYDLMGQSPTEVDSQDNQAWPDPLTVKYTEFYFNEPPTQFAVDDTFYIKPYLSCYALYQEASMDDIILNINSVPHISLIPLGETILFPVKSDIIKFAKKKV